ncbi:DUF1659 domain-containing protein [Clostridium sp. 19966]|uniref:DUF1659 domain-containing protein n=1 Tax=Clostridium sp. 19966 TaxID=2768166 RepID=UPI0028DF8131|nr:DUF1659 domain-containing protein [Clostridium sp. 19966]MDT8719608.1 DUF1659 domain-containing protein [Clostridium sp. 19966]
MAVQTTKNSSAITLKIKQGVDAKGNDIVKSIKFSKVKVNAADEDVFAIASAVAGLLQYPVVQILRSDDSVIIQA